MSDNTIGRSGLNNLRKFQKTAGSQQNNKLGKNQEQKPGLGSQKETFLKSLVGDTTAYGKMSSAGLAATAAVGMSALTLPSLIAPALMGGVLAGAIGGFFGGMMGHEMGKMLGSMPKPEGVTITPSGIEERKSGYRTKIALPDGSKLEHSRGLDGIKDLSAKDSDGNKLKAEVVKDGESGNEQIRLTDGTGKTTTYNPANMELNVSGTTVDPSTDTKVNLKQTIRADGSMQFIVDEGSSFVTDRQENPLNKGEFGNVTVPLSHSYTQVDLTADGDSSVNRVKETYSLKGKSGSHSSKRNTFSDWLGAKSKEDLSTNLDTSGAIRVTAADTGKLKSGLKTAVGFMGSMVGGPVGPGLSYADKPLEFQPFVTREQMKDAHAQLVESRLDEMAKDMKEPVAVKRSAGGTVMADLGGKEVRTFGPNGERMTSTRINAGVASTPLASDSKVFVTDKHNKLHGIGFYGSEWKAELGGDMLAEPTFNKDGDVVVLVDKDSRIAAKTFSPKGELKENKLLKGDPEALRTPEQKQARLERKERKEFLNFARESLNAKDASIPQMAKLVGMNIAMNTDVLEVAGDSRVSLHGDPIKKLEQGGKDNSGLQETMEKAFVDFLNTDEGGDKFFKAAHANNPELRPQAREGSSMAGMLENMDNAAKGDNLPLAERKMREYLARNTDQEPAGPQSVNLVDGDRTYNGSPDDLATSYESYLKS